MSTTVDTLANPQGREAGLVEVAAKARDYLRASKASSTLRAYGSDWADFSAWCQRQGLRELPAEPATVALYLTALAADHKPATLNRRLTSIARAHEAAGYSSPATMRQAVVSETRKGIRRTHGVAQTGKRALLTADLQQLLAHLPKGLLGSRDRALLLTGYAGGLRRSELAALELRDLEFTNQGATLTIRRSKADQEGEGRKVVLPRGAHPASCPVQALWEWLDRSDVDHKIKEGPLFRAIDRHGRVSHKGLHPDSVGAILKRMLGRAGYDPKPYGGHSLRAGFATQAAINGATELEIMRQTGHRSLTTLRRYIREGQLFRSAAAGKLGL